MAMFTDGTGRCPYQPVAVPPLHDAQDGESHNRRDLRRIVADPCDGPRSLPGRGHAGAGLVLGLASCLLAMCCLLGRPRSGQVARPRVMLDGGRSVGVDAAAQPAGHCPSSAELSDFSSKARMEQFGWLFGWTGRDAFRPDRVLYASYVPRTSYWGFSESVDGEIALVVRGHGFFTLDFGNSWTGPQSQVVVYLNGVPQSRAGAMSISRIVKAPFQDGDVLRLVESNGVIVINSIFFDCTGVPSPEVQTPDAQSTSGEQGSSRDQAIQTPISSTSTPFQAETSTLTTTSNTSSTTSTTSVTTTFAMDRAPHVRPNGTAERNARQGSFRGKREQQRAKAGIEELDMSQVQKLKRRAEKQLKSESDISATLAKESKQLQKLEDMEKQELLKAQRDMQMKEDLEKQLNRMTGDELKK
mmetsp:Transcript_62330/g.182073  ORF Transcript_62330/g.182073 Transcript_62330/m.182073 type:complete len:414 (-) Transcript_62330:89-1330(-)